MSAIRSRARRRTLWPILERLEPRALLATITVTSTADTERRDGVTTLREAIGSINEGGDIGLGVPADGAYGVDDTINFNIPGAGIQTINVIASGLPGLRNPAVIDGLTQPGSTPVAPLIRLDGARAGRRASGLVLDEVADSVIRGFIVAHFNVNGVLVVGGSNNTIQSNFIGTDGSAASLPNRIGVNIRNSTGDIVRDNVISGNAAGPGVLISGSGNTVSQNLIGTDLSRTQAVPNRDGVRIDTGVGNFIVGNLISGNGDVGVLVNAAGNRITNNLIGVNGDGTAALGNRFDGIDLVVTARNTVIDGNVISGNGGHGVVIDGEANTIMANHIGTDLLGRIAIPNFGDGVLLRIAAKNNLIETSVIAFNGQAGVAVRDAGSVGNRITINRIFANGRLGIDLGADGVTPNVPPSRAVGPNNLINFPVLTQVEIEEDEPEMTLEGTAPPGSAVELFVADPDPSGFGQGKTYIATVVEGSANDLDPLPGGFRFVLALPVPTQVFIGALITATATTTTSGTSEFSANAMVTVLPPVTVPPVEPPVEPPITEPPIDPPPEPPITEPPPIPPPVVVVILRRFGVHAQPTRLALVFSNLLDAASAQDLTHYQLAVLARGRRVTLRIASAVYNEGGMLVVLQPQRRLPLKFQYQLTVAGVLDGMGRPVVPFMQNFGREALVGFNR